MGMVQTGRTPPSMWSGRAVSLVSSLPWALGVPSVARAGIVTFGYGQGVPEGPVLGGLPLRATLFPNEACTDTVCSTRVHSAK